MASRSRLRIIILNLFGISALVALALTAAGIWFRVELGKSLPQLTGELEIKGLRNRVMIERDAQGIPTINAFNALDQMTALGFLHAQDRFFQMDMFRRVAAGEVAELVPAGLDIDLRNRVHQLRARSQESVRNLPDFERSLLSAYSLGVNAGLNAMPQKPFEYLILRAEPTPWRDEDTLLVALAMAEDLQDAQGYVDRVRGLLSRRLPEPVFDYFFHNATRWEAPQDGTQRPRLPIPDAEAFAPITRQWPSAPDSHDWAPRHTREGTRYFAESGPNGSNSWAISGARNAEGTGAWVANDMHLELRVPTPWYRVTIFTETEDQQPVYASGVTLPGVPAIVVGSNGFVAWTLTNSNADTTDVVRLVTDSSRPGMYQTDEGWLPFESSEEQIQVSGKPPRALTVQVTVFGPVIGTDDEGYPLAAQWTAHTHHAVDLGVSQLIRARSAESALRMAQRLNAPAMNFVVGDREGSIGWTIFGTLPQRTSENDGFLPRLSNDAAARWTGRKIPEAYPTLVNPKRGFIQTANARIVGGEALQGIGDGGYAFPARQWVIDKALAEDRPYTFEDSKALILSNEVSAMKPWQALLLKTLENAPNPLSPIQEKARTHVASWESRAEADSVGYRLIREFRGTVLDRLYDRILGYALQHDPAIHGIRGSSGMGIPVEDTLLTIAESQPEYLADPYFKSWSAELLFAFDRVLENAVQSGGIDAYTWGKFNAFQLRHPISRALPILSKGLDHPPMAVSTDRFAPNALLRNHGPSQRMIVEVGAERRGAFAMPGGQSGHPLSPFFRTEHEAWVEGIAGPFLPGETQYTLILAPAEADF